MRFVLPLLLLACGPAPLPLPAAPPDAGVARADTDGGAAADAGIPPPAPPDAGVPPPPPLLDDDAEVVSASFRTSVLATELFTATVVLRNTGTATWSPERAYRLGTASTTDPFFPQGRVQLA